MEKREDKMINNSYTLFNLILYNKYKLFIFLIISFFIKLFIKFFFDKYSIEVNLLNYKFNYNIFYFIFLIIINPLLMLILSFTIYNNLYCLNKIELDFKVIKKLNLIDFFYFLFFYLMFLILFYFGLIVFIIPGIMFLVIFIFIFPLYFIYKNKKELIKETINFYKKNSKSNSNFVIKNLFFIIFFNIIFFIISYFLTKESQSNLNIHFIIYLKMFFNELIYILIYLNINLYFFNKNI